MNAAPIDWIIAALFLVFLTFGGVVCKRFVSEVSDWTVAGRNMRKYLSLSTGIAEGIAIGGIASMLEIGFTSGLAFIGVSILSMMIIPLVYGCTGFVVNRYREEKVVTVPEYAQRRYSKGVRVTTGLVLAISGILNLAIFPIMASEFLKYFLDAPDSISIFGQAIPFVPFLMSVLILLALIFAYAGGMVSIVLTDYIQSVIIAFMMFVTTWLAIKHVGWRGIHETIETNSI